MKKPNLKSKLDDDPASYMKRMKRLIRYLI